jgi:hypothetical protein
MSGCLSHEGGVGRRGLGRWLFGRRGGGWSVPVAASPAIAATAGRALWRLEETGAPTLIEAAQSSRPPPTDESQGQTDPAAGCAHGPMRTGGWRPVPGSLAEECLAVWSACALGNGHVWFLAQANVEGSQINLVGIAHTAAEFASVASGWSTCGVRIVGGDGCVEELQQWIELSWRPVVIWDGIAHAPGNG